jgi:membrane protein DedA with SNARE-associated domain/rhodanese-related sulfurtransferase
VTLTLDSMFSQFGFGLVVANVLLEQAGLPIPAIPTLIVAGAVAADHHSWGAAVFVGAVAACVVADLGWYLAGRRYGNAVMRFLCRISLTPDFCVSETQQRFERWGQNAVVMAKFVPGLTVIAPPLAGALRMSVLRFVALSTTGSSLWVGSFLLLGALCKTQINQLLPALQQYAALTLAVVVALLTVYIAFKWWERRKFYEKLRMARINVEELHELMELGRAPVIVDVRSVSARTVLPKRIPGALHVTHDQVGRYAKDMEPHREVVLYCTCPNEASAVQVAKLLMDHGFLRVRPLYGGLDAWIAAGYPVEVVQVEGSAIV